MSICTRFAPSPTGDLHIGGVRTALFSWLFAKRHHGQFILRIEDTDLERSTQSSVDAILQGMKWLGLDYDQGPYYQTQRFDRYKAVLKQLLDNGYAYRCYCSKDRLEDLRTQHMLTKQKPRYDGHCLRHAPVDASLPSVIRFKNPTTGAVVINDLVHGMITVANSELDDLVLARQDGTPTYNFTVVVDDWDMAITHVIRGDDHINNTPRQINLFNALGVKPPQYAHIPMILGADSKRLSKRHGATNIMEYRTQGYLPEAILNYLVRLGWSHGDQEIFSRNEMCELFNLDSVNKSPAAMNPEKLLWLNQHYLKTGEPDYIAEQLRGHLNAIPGVNVDNGVNLIDVVVAQRERVKTLVEMAEKSAFFFTDTITSDDALWAKHAGVDIIPALQVLREKLSELNTNDWTATNIHALINEVAEQHEIKLGKLAQPLRIALTGGTVSPPIDLTLQILGKAKTMERLVV